MRLLSSEEILRRDIAASQNQAKGLHHDGRQAANWPAFVAGFSEIDTLVRCGSHAIVERRPEEMGGDWLDYLRPEAIARKLVTLIGEQSTVDLIMLLADEPMRIAALKAIGAYDGHDDGQPVEFDFPAIVKRATANMERFRGYSNRTPSLLAHSTEPPDVFEAELQTIRAKRGEGLVESFMGAEK